MGILKTLAASLALVGMVGLCTQVAAQTTTTTTSSSSSSSSSSTTVTVVPASITLDLVTCVCQNDRTSQSCSDCDNIDLCVAECESDGGIRTVNCILNSALCDSSTTTTQPPVSTTTTTLPIDECCGDPNGNGVAEIVDALTPLFFAVGLIPVCPKTCCDVNIDGVVNLADALAILEVVVGVSTQSTLVCPTAVLQVVVTESPVPIGGISVEVDYSGTNIGINGCVSGGFDISASAFNNITGILTVAVAQLAGFEPKRTISVCQVEGVLPGDAALITTTVLSDADVDLEDISPDPTVVVDLQ